MKLLFLFLVAIVTLPLTKSNGDELWVYFGTYTRDKDSEGIYSAKLNLKTGQLTKPVLAANGDNPSFLTILPNENFLLAVEETNDYEGEPSGSIVSYSINASDGSLIVSDRISTKGG
ncbi:MAG: beta-propeller fold lactonase family protein, partial [Verrucomicrobiota bacterium]|nr:beta-propeller fold lactonase family protein [Verrucomicrobiota bacterium]